MRLNDLPIDASMVLSDDSSSRLEPYNLNEMKDFDEDYLLGFYSNISDITYGRLRNAASERADEYFDELAMKSVHGARKLKVHSSDHVTAIDYNNLKYTLLPASKIWRLLETITLNGNSRINFDPTGVEVGKFCIFLGKFCAWLSGFACF